MRLALNALKIALDEAATQYRLLQKRLLTLFKDPKPVSMEQLSALLEGCYHQVGKPVFVPVFVPRELDAPHCPCY